MLIRPIISILFSLLIITCLGQSNDTILNMVMSKPYFYNVIQEGNGRVFVGTSEGIFEMKGTTPRQYSSRKGYLTMNTKGEPVVDSNGIKYHRNTKFARLLPYQEVVREEYHAREGNIFYISSGGRLYIFDILNYRYSYTGHSFRSISKNLLSTYSGIYLNGKRLSAPAPVFTDGYVREYGERAFLCSYGLFVLEKQALATGKLIPGVNYFTYEDTGRKFINDIFPVPDEQGYLIASQEDLSIVDKNFKISRVLYKKKNGTEPITLIGGDSLETFFTDEGELLSFRYKANNTIFSKVKLPEPIMAGIFDNDQIYLVTRKALYRFNSGQILEKLSAFENAHTLCRINGSELVISSDIGLYLFNTVTRESSIIVKGVEFNRRALYVDNDILHAGSANGLYSITLQDIPSLVMMNKSELPKDKFTKDIEIAGIMLFLIIAMLIFLVFRYKRKLQTVETKLEVVSLNEVHVSKEKVEEFIRINLSNASLKSINEHFGTNTTQLYTILKPEKPGSIIQKIRMEIVDVMRKAGKSNLDVSQVTGLSVSYLKKLKNNIESSS